jgi:malate/lactate dehydrogenase
LRTQLPLSSANAPAAKITYATSAIDAAIAGDEGGAPKKVKQCTPNMTRANPIVIHTWRAAYHIIAGKGATYYGNRQRCRPHETSCSTTSARSSRSARASRAFQIVRVSPWLPHLIGGDGVLATIPLSLDDSESAALRASAAVIRETVESLAF